MLSSCLVIRIRAEGPSGRKPPEGRRRLVRLGFGLGTVLPRVSRVHYSYALDVRVSTPDELISFPTAQIILYFYQDILTLGESHTLKICLSQMN